MIRMIILMVEMIILMGQDDCSWFMAHGSRLGEGGWSRLRESTTRATKAQPRQRMHNPQNVSEVLHKVTCARRQRF